MAVWDFSKEKLNLEANSSVSVYDVSRFDGLGFLHYSPEVP